MFSLFSCFAKQGKADGGSRGGFRSVSMSEGLSLMGALEDGQFVLLDVRRPDEFAQGHIPGARLLTNETISAETVRELLPDTTQPLFVYCRSGRRSKEAAQKLAALGYTNITEIGGILDYAGELAR